MILPAFWAPDVADVIRHGSPADAARARGFVVAAKEAALYGRSEFLAGYLTGWLCSVAVA